MSAENIIPERVTISTRKHSLEGMIYHPKNPINRQVLIVPGRNEMLYKYQDFYKLLSACGIKVIIYDHIGQGFSPRITEDSQMCHIDTFDTYKMDNDTVFEKYYLYLQGLFESYSMYFSKLENEDKEFQKEVIDAFHKQLGLNDSELKVDLDSLLNIDSGFFVVYASNIINRMKAANELNKQIMGVSDNDLEKFSTRIVGFDEEELDSLGKVGAAEYVQRVITKEAAMENYLKNKDAMYPDMRSGSK